MRKSRLLFTVIPVILALIITMVFSGCSPQGEESILEKTEGREEVEYTDEAEEETWADEEKAEAEAAAEVEEAVEEESYTIGISMPDTVATFWSVLVDYGVAYLEDMGHEVIVVDAGDDPTVQDNQIRDLIARKVDAIIVTPIDQYQICSSFTAGKEAGIKMIAMSRIPSCLEDVEFSVGADEYQIAVIITEWLGQYAEDNDMDINLLLLVGSLGDNAGVLRRAGVLDTVGRFDRVNVVQEIPTDWDHDKALSGVTNALQANPEINAIFNPSDYILPPIISALQSANKLFPAGDPNHIIITTIDGNPNSLDYIREGIVDINVSHDPLGWAEQAADAALAAIRGDKIIGKLSIALPIPATIDNVDELGTKLWGNILTDK